MLLVKIRYLLVLIALCSVLHPAQGSMDNRAELTYREGKEAVLRKEWRTAVSVLEKFKSEFRDSRVAAAGIYWLAYSRYNIGVGFKGEKGLAELTGTLEDLKYLATRYENSKWVDDGMVLKVRVAVELKDRGDAGGEKLLTEVLVRYGDSLSDCVLLAMEALIDIKGEKIFQHLLEIKKPFLAREAVFSFSRSREDMVPFEEKPDFLKYPADLTYPSLALKSWISWTSVMEIKIDKTGKVVKVRTICGAVNHRKLDSEVEKELFRCRYAPVKDDMGREMEVSFVEIWRYKYNHTRRTWKILRWIDQSRGGIADYE